MRSAVVVRFWAVFLVLLVRESRGQDAVVPGEGASTCYGPGSMAASVILTLILTILLEYLLYVIWKRYWKNRTGNHLVLQTDPEKGRKEEYAFDNAGFRDASTTPSADKLSQKTGTSTLKSKWSQWSPLGAFMTKNEKQKTLDDSFLQGGDEIKTVSLKSHDFTGLGFNIYGNMRDGIFIKDILNRGPASQSGKLNPGDRIQNITINFEHVVYEDALTILSYASPYEVILEARTSKPSGHNQHTPTKTIQIGHPLYRSSSAADLMQMSKSSKKCLFPPDSSSTATTTRSPYSSLQKKETKSPDMPEIPSYEPRQLKQQLEQKISQNHRHQLKVKETQYSPPQPSQEDVQKTENKYQKFGIKVLPVNSKDLHHHQHQQISPKSPELSQNENNINLERHMDRMIDEADSKGDGAAFVRQGSVTGSGIKRDKDGIPQEIPNHMFNAAVAARRNRKASTTETADANAVKSPKKPKGRAPAPPDNPRNFETSSPDHLRPGDDDKPDYASDSDAETDNQSSVNTIELNASDITIHQTEESEEIQNRKTASTGDLTKIQRARKTSNGTLERAQSLDITDTGMPTLAKKRKGGSIEENIGSDESLTGNKALNPKEPRLSLALDGLNTFQRSRLKKSTEWGNLEDAVQKDTEEEKANDSEFDALVNKINEIKMENFSSDGGDEKEKEEEPPVVTPCRIELNGDGVIENDTSHATWTPTVNVIEPDLKKLSSVTSELLLTERQTSDYDPYYDIGNKIDVNASDDLKVSRHLEKSPTITSISNIPPPVPVPPPPSEETQNESSEVDENAVNTSPDLIKNLILTEAICDINETVTIEGPTSLTLEVPSSNEVENITNISTATVSSKPNYSLTYITEIQVTTPSDDVDDGKKIDDDDDDVQKDPQKELNKIQEIAEEQLKKLPEMRFTTSSYEPSSKSSPPPPPPENYPSYIEQIRSNFEKGSPPKVQSKTDTITKSRIPVATSKTPPTSPERRDSRNFDLEVDKEIIAIMSAPPPPVTNLKFQSKINNKNVSVTSIRSNSKIPSGLQARPPVPPRKYDDTENLHRVSTNGNGESSFKQWLFNPNNNAVTNVTITESRMEQK